MDQRQMASCHRMFWATFGLHFDKHFSTDGRQPCLFCFDMNACFAAAVKAVCSEYRIHNADVHLKEDCDVDDLVDVIEGSRVYIPCIFVLNKIDQVSHCGG